MRLLSRFPRDGVAHQRLARSLPFLAVLPIVEDSPQLKDTFR